MDTKLPLLRLPSKSRRFRRGRPPSTLPKVVDALEHVESKLREAAGLGHRQAQLALGKLLRRNLNAQEAFPLIRSAAEDGGVKEAQLILGMLLAFGDGCERDDREKEARRWLLRWGNFANFADVDLVLFFAAAARRCEEVAGKAFMDGLGYKERALSLISVLDAHGKVEAEKERLALYLNVTDVFDASSGCEGQTGVSLGKCDNCGEYEVVKSCGRCTNAKYCGRECQIAHWKSHKKAYVK